MKNKLFCSKKIVVFLFILIFSFFIVSPVEAKRLQCENLSKTLKFVYPPGLSSTQEEYFCSYSILEYTVDDTIIYISPVDINYDYPGGIAVYNSGSKAKKRMEEQLPLTKKVFEETNYGMPAANRIPLTEEDISIGEGGKLIFAGNRDYAGDEGIPPQKRLQEDWIPVYRAAIMFTTGKCVVSITADTDVPETRVGSKYHIRSKGNQHPGFDHGKQSLTDKLTQIAREVESNSAQICGGNISNPLNHTQSLVIEPPKESDFQKVSKSDFKQVNPVGTASATLKSATESANITGSMFIGKVGGDGELILQLPDGKEVSLKDDKSAFEGERPSGFRFRDFKGSGSNYTAPKRHVYVKEIDCNILLEQERRDQEIIKRTGGITYASDWGVDETIIVKPTGNCSYTNEGGPVRVLAGQGQATFKTPGGVAVSAENADFGIGYNAKSGLSVIEVYNGSITVTNKAGNAKTMSATYGSEIKQIEVDKEGVTSEKIAIPLSQWQAFLASKQEKKDETKGITLPIVGVAAVLGLGGIAFFLYRSGKLIPLYQTSKQKIAELLKKISKEKKTD